MNEVLDNVRDQEDRGFSKLLFWGGLFLILYIVSLGPVLYLFSLFKLLGPNSIGILEIIYYPHVIVCDVFMPYEHYLEWCIQKGGQMVNY